MNCNDDWIDALNYSIQSVEDVKKKAIENWFNSHTPPYNPYLNHNFGTDMRLLERKNCRCVPFDFNMVDEITYENGNISFHYGVGKMNLENLSRLKRYLESKDLNVCGVFNETVFGVKVIRIVFRDCFQVNEGNLSHVLQVSEDDVHHVTGDVFYVKLSALAKHYNDCGKLEIAPPFKLTNVTFKRSNLKAIKRQLACELGICDLSFDVDIWDDCLMIKSDGSYLANLTRMDIARALDINDGYVHCIDRNKWYYILKWD